MLIFKQTYNINRNKYLIFIKYMLKKVLTFVIIKDNRSERQYTMHII